MNNKWQWGDESPPSREQKTISKLEHLMRMSEFAPSKVNYEKLQKFIEELSND
jgi:hypothetical protein